MAILIAVNIVCYDIAFIGSLYERKSFKQVKNPFVCNRNTPRGIGYRREGFVV